MLKTIKTGLVAVAVVAIALLAYQAFLSPKAASPSTREYHAHADFAVFVNGQKLDFAKEEFMHKETCGKPGEEEPPIDLNTPEGMAEAAHLHDLNGNVAHFHHENATLAMFFKGLDFGLTGECFETREARYCNTDFKKIKVFANGMQIADIEKYVPSDLDKILVTYGEESASEIRAENEQLTNQACIYSEKCPKPEGFVITPESCA
ncbi:MAG: hypothetical protein QXR53_03445 [Candidatus Norongarragalinales archaeon]